MMDVIFFSLSRLRVVFLSKLILPYFISTCALAFLVTSQNVMAARGKGQLFRETRGYAGKCNTFILADQDMRAKCKDRLAYFAFLNGRVVFAVTRKDGSTFMFSGSKEIIKKRTPYKLELDTVYGLDSKGHPVASKIPVKGKCTIDRSKRSKPVFSCRAKTGNNQHYELVFQAKSSTGGNRDNTSRKAKNKILRHCNYMSQVGMYFKSAKEMNISTNAKVNYIVGRIQKKAKSRDPKMLKKFTSIYYILLDRLEDFKPDTYAAYVLGTCISIYGLKKAVPSDAVSQRKINTMLRKCENESTNKDTTGACVLKNLKPIVIEKNIQLKGNTG